MYPTLYEINTRVWLNKFGKGASLSDVPLSYWENLKQRGVDYVWLMGVWATTASSIAKHCFHPDLVMAYNQVTTDWVESDIKGSPYAIEDYVLAEDLGGKEDLRILKQRLNQLGLKLILDFIPNHFNADSKLLESNADIFLQVSEADFRADPYTYFRRADKFFAHGKDPYFPAWSDTVQVNYNSPAAHKFMKNRLLQVAEYSDGVRCDMAMLILPDVFQNTWASTISPGQPDFWTDAIDEVKSKDPDFIFIAEAYWDTEWRLHLMGFDYTYDKKLLDFIVRDQINNLKSHLAGSLEYHNQTVRFIENHDEERSLTSLGESKAKAAAILYNTLPGMRLHYDGQWSGERIRYPVQIGTYFEPDLCICSIKNNLDTQENPCACMDAFYHRLMKVCSCEVFKYGAWKLIDTYPYPNDCIVVEWSHDNTVVLVAVNMGFSPNEITIPLPDQWTKEVIRDVLNEEPSPNYITVVENNINLRLPGFKGCILSN